MDGYSALVVPQNEMCKTFRPILLICDFSINAKSKLSIAFKMIWVMKHTFFGKRLREVRLYHTSFPSVIEIINQKILQVWPTVCVCVNSKTIN